jgi:superfamily I DNA/RNA helicase
MSRILPEPLVGQFAPEVIAIYRALKAIPGDDFTAWVSLPWQIEGARPDFLLVWRDRHVFLLAVAETGLAALEEAAGLSLFRAENERPGQGEAERLRQFFLATLAKSSSFDRGGSVTGLVLFPHVPQKVLEQLPPGLRPSDVFFLGRECCQSKTLEEFLLREIPPELEEEALAVLRSAFTPESVIPRSFAPARVVDRRLAASLTPLLLDFEQEQWAKHRLSLSPEAAQAVPSERVAEGEPAYGGASLVTGVAGSGKSLVLLFRACTQARLAPQSRSLVLTHNRPLKCELEARFGELGRPPNVVWHTFFSWVHELVTAHERLPEIVQYRERDALIAACAEPFWGKLSAVQIEFLRDEFDWMQDRDLTAQEAYLEAERTGRGIALGATARQRVFAAYRTYRQELEQNGREDWSGLALMAARRVEEGRIQPPQFDFIYIDEAQFFAPVWFRVIRAAQRPGCGQIHLAADPTQGFLKRRQAWSQCGFDLRGRSTRLRRAYRSTRAILEFAADFYRLRLDDEDLPELNLPAEEELSCAPAGSRPVILPLSARQDEWARIGAEIRACLEEGLSPEEILVIVSGEQRAFQGLEFLQSQLGENSLADARHGLSRGKIRVCSINAATGLEAAVVFLVGIADLIAAEEDYHLKDEARAERLRDNTRKLYMAFTRAARKLVITWTGQRRPDWFDLAEHRSGKC